MLMYKKQVKHPVTDVIKIEVTYTKRNGVLGKELKLSMPLPTFDCFKYLPCEADVILSVVLATSPVLARV